MGDSRSLTPLAPRSAPRHERRRLRQAFGHRAELQQTFGRRAELQKVPQPAQDRLPHEGQPGAERAGQRQALGQARGLRRPAREGSPQGPVRLPRRPTLCQRRHPPGPPAQQGAQRPGRAQQVHGRLRLPLHPRLGLPRPAHRTQGHARPGRPTYEECQRARRAEDPQEVRELRQQVRQNPEGPDAALADDGRLRRPVPHHAAEVRSRRAGRLRGAG